MTRSERELKVARGSDKEEGAKGNGAKGSERERHGAERS